MTDIHPAKPRDGATDPRKLPRGESQADRKKRFQKIYHTLEKLYPNSVTALEFTNPFELVVATVLSAQTTDKRVNLVMPEFRKRFPNPKALAAAELAEIEHELRTIGFFRQKAKSVKKLAQMLLDDFGGKVPETMDDLVKLPGVGRKTANVVLADAFEKPVGIAVDTHVTRVSARLGLTKNDDPIKIERDLMDLATLSQYTQTSHELIYHGRNTCIARKPKCSECVVAEDCPSAGFPGSA
jgi:endonuclease-3